MSKVYLIAGLGADSRIFKNIQLDEEEVINISWIEPANTDTLKTYAQKLILQYNMSPLSIVIGNSLGGMIAVEIGKIIPLKKVILVSSIKTVDEAPRYFTFFRALPLYKLIPGTVMTSMGPLAKFVFGRMSDEDSRLFNDMLKNSSPVFIKWAMKAILAWDNKIVPPNTYIITGDNDAVFDYRRIKDAIIVKGGTHIMIFDMAREISELLKQLIKT
jgi:pimeloyl-ACP methyl ester carboxylesterase